MNDVTVNDIFNNIAQVDPSVENNNDSKKMNAIFNNIHPTYSIKQDGDTKTATRPAECVDINKLGSDYLREDYKPLPRNSWGRTLTPTPCFGYPTVDFTMKRFMDASYDNYTLNNFPETELYSERVRHIKRILTVEEWDILNGTNFMSSLPMIHKYFAVIRKLIENNVFTPEQPLTISETGYRYLGESMTNVAADNTVSTIVIKGSDTPRDVVLGDVVTFGISQYRYDGEKWIKL